MERDKIARFLTRFLKERGLCHAFKTRSHCPNITRLLSEAQSSHQPLAITMAMAFMGDDECWFEEYHEFRKLYDELIC